MILNDEQKAMLNGDLGEGAAYAMKIQFALGEAFDAKRMVPIKRAHVALSNQDGDLWFAEKLVKAGAHCKVAPTVNPGFCTGHFTGACGHPADAEDIAHMIRTDNAYRALGAVLSYNCTPYIATNVPNFGEVCAFSESSATPYVNSVWGARSNRESANSALCAAITGYVPEYGLLLDENRKGDILVRVEADMKTPYEYHLLGMMGDKIGEGIPVFTGLPHTISPEALRNLGAQLNTSGAYGMYHIVGCTPEAPTVEAALGGKKPKYEVVITNEDLQNVEDTLQILRREIQRKLRTLYNKCPISSRWWGIFTILIPHHPLFSFHYLPASAYTLFLTLPELAVIAESQLIHIKFHLMQLKWKYLIL